VVPAVLRVLSQELGLQREDVIEHAVDMAALDTMVCDDPGALEVAAKQSAERPVDASLAVKLSLLEQLEASVQGQLSRPVLSHAHVRRSPGPPPGLRT
jgi:hypothetical protein